MSWWYFLSCLSQLDHFIFIYSIVHLFFDSFVFGNKIRRNKNLFLCACFGVQTKFASWREKDWHRVLAFEIKGWTRQTTQLLEVTRWRHRFTMAFTLAGSAPIPLSLTMKAKSLLEDSPTRGFYLFLLNWFRRSKVDSKSRKIMPRKSKSHRLSFILPVYKKEGNEQWMPGRAAL